MAELNYGGNKPPIQDGVLDDRCLLDMHDNVFEAPSPAPQLWEVKTTERHQQNSKPPIQDGVLDDRCLLDMNDNLFGAPEPAISEKRTVREKTYLPGISVTTRPPHAVLSVLDLMDENLLQQGMPGYRNEIVMPGDSILEVDGIPCQHYTVEKLNQLLQGIKYTLAEIVLARRNTFDRYKVRVIRHRERDYDLHYDAAPLSMPQWNLRPFQAAIPETSSSDEPNSSIQRASRSSTQRTSPAENSGGHKQLFSRDEAVEIFRQMDTNGNREIWHGAGCVSGANSPSQEVMNIKTHEELVQMSLQDGRATNLERWNPVWGNLQIGCDPNVQIDAKSIRIFEGHGDMINACAWSEADGGAKWVLSASSDQTLRLWDVENNVCGQVLQGHDGPVWCCSLSSRDGGKRWALSGGRDKTLRVFDLQAGECVRVLAGHKASVFGCHWSGAESLSRSILSASADKTLRVWDAQTGVCRQILSGHSGAVTCCEFSIADGGGRWVLSGSDDSTLRIWDLEQASCQTLLKGHSEAVLCCKWSGADGGRRYVLSSGWDKLLIIWDAASAATVLTLQGHAAPVYGCSWSCGDGGARWVLSASYDETLKLWDASSGACLRSMVGHTRWVRCCHWSNAHGGKRWLISGSRDKQLRLWELTLDDLHDTSILRTHSNAPSLQDACSISSCSESVENSGEDGLIKARVSRVDKLQRSAAPPKAHDEASLTPSALVLSLTPSAAKADNRGGDGGDGIGSTHGMLSCASDVPLVSMYDADKVESDEQGSALGRKGVEGVETQGLNQDMNDHEYDLESHQIERLKTQNEILMKENERLKRENEALFLRNMTHCEGLERYSSEVKAAHEASAHTKKLLSAQELKLEQVQQAYDSVCSELIQEERKRSQEQSNLQQVQQAYEALQIQYKKHVSDASESEASRQSMSGGERERLSAEWNKLESEKSKVDSDKRQLQTEKLELESQKRELQRLLASTHKQIEHEKADAERILQEANVAASKILQEAHEAATEVRERLKESVESSQARLVSAATLDSSTAQELERAHRRIKHLETFLGLPLLRQDDSPTHSISSPSSSRISSISSTRAEIKQEFERRRTTTNV